MPTPLLDYAPPPPSSNRLRTALAALLNAVRCRAKRLLAITVCVLVALIPIGYASNSASAAGCEKRVADWVARTALGGRAFYVGTGQNTDALTKLPGAVSRLDSGTSGGPLFPWAQVGPARSAAPFIVNVDYGWVREPQIGSGGRRRFLCLFGHIIEIGDQPRWAT